MNLSEAHNKIKTMEVYGGFAKCGKCVCYLTTDSNYHVINETNQDDDFEIICDKCFARSSPKLKNEN